MREHASNSSVPGPAKAGAALQRLLGPSHVKHFDSCFNKTIDNDIKRWKIENN